MLRIVLVNEDDKLITKSREIIAKLFIEKDIPYKCYRFNKNDEELEKYISNKNENDIYVIIDSKNIDSNNIIDKIRNKYHNIAPFIIVICLHDKEKIKILKSKRFYNTEIITEIKEYEKRVIEVLNDVLCYLDEDKKCLIQKKNKMIYKIPFSDILYIEKEANSKIINIHCKTEILKFYACLNEIKNMLDTSFRQTHRSFIVNMSNVASLNMENGLVKFNNNQKEYLISRSYKKSLRNDITKQGIKITE